MDKDASIMDLLITFFSLVPLILYTIVAILLTIIAVFSVWDALQLISQMIISRDFANGLVNILYALLMTITIIVLFETVTVYFRTKHIEVRALIAGLTGMVRHVLIYNVGTVDPEYIVRDGRTPCSPYCRYRVCQAGATRVTFF